MFVCGFFTIAVRGFVIRMPEFEGEKDKINSLLHFEKVTGIFPKDFFSGDDYLLFIVPPGMKGKAIGSMGANIKKLKFDTNRQIIVCELLEDPKDMIINYFENVTILNVKNRDNRYFVYVPDEDRGKAIGRNGYRIKGLKQVFKKYFADADVAIKAISVIDQPGTGTDYSGSESSFVHETTLAESSGTDLWAELQSEREQ